MARSTGRMQGQIALVTGGSSGIGAACAERFAAEGALVTILDVQKPSDALRASLAEIDSDAYSAGVDFHEADIRQEAEVASAIESIVAKHGRLDSVLHAAGTAGAGVAHTLDLEAWTRVIDINLTGSFLVAKHALRPMLAQKSGSIVLISSVEGLAGGNIVPAYNASKGGVVLLMNNLAMDYGKHGIRVNCICPGFIDTPMLAGFNDHATPAERRRMEKTHMLERFGKPEEIAAAAQFLCSSDASFITGHALAVDGGFLAGHPLVVVED